MRHILMGDVVASSRYDQNKLRLELKSLVARCNKVMSARILSPYTITLGDEFQGVAASLVGGIEALLFLEMERLRRGYDFRLHYVVHGGEISTPINREIAYGMMGPGLTRARELLGAKQRSRPRFIFEYPDSTIADAMNDLFYVVEQIVDHWRPRDYPLILDMIADDSNEAVGNRHHKDRTLVWRRRATLRVTEYKRLVHAVVLLAEEFDRGAKVAKGRAVGSQA